MPSARRVAQAFALGGRIIDVSPYGHGIINDTYRVTIESEMTRRVILQRINPQVFPLPALIMENLRTLLDHIRQRRAGVRHEIRDLRLPEIYTTHDQEDYLIEPEGDFWRVIGFIENACSVDTIADLRQAEEVGFALGSFHHLMHDLDPSRLHDTLPGFHITPRYLDRFTEVSTKRKPPSPSQELRFCFSFIETHRSLAGVLEDGKQQGLLRIRPIHGDPKLDNILFDKESGRAVSLIDLDTVQPGLVHYDIGDCLRSCCNTAGESPDDPTVVHFDLDICKAILTAYFFETRSFLNGHDFDYLYDAIRLIPFELGLRFLTDYLEGNQYFKVREPEQNLRRALTQFQLTVNIEQHESSIKELISAEIRS